MNEERNKLVEELERRLSNPTSQEEIANFIIADRLRIVEPGKQPAEQNVKLPKAVSLEDIRLSLITACSDFLAKHATRNGYDTKHGVNMSDVINEHALAIQSLIEKGENENNH